MQRMFTAFLPMKGPYYTVQGFISMPSLLGRWVEIPVCAAHAEPSRSKYHLQKI